MVAGVKRARVPDAAASTAVSRGRPVGVDAAAMAARLPVVTHRGSFVDDDAEKDDDDDDDDDDSDDDDDAAVPAAGPRTVPRRCAS